MLYSCTQAKLLTVSSNDVELKGSQFVYESDSIRISYNFWAVNGIMSFDIYNKTDYPIFFDWKNSSFIPNKQMVSYWQDETNSTNVGLTNWYYSTRFAKSVSKSIRKERIGGIPPHAQITKSEYRIIREDDKIPDVGNYTEKETFLDFRNYLLFSNNEKFEGMVSSIDNKFFVSSIRKIKYKDREKYNSPNMFVVKAVSSSHYSSIKYTKKK